MNISPNEIIVSQASIIVRLEQEVAHLKGDLKRADERISELRQEIDAQRELRYVQAAGFEAKLEDVATNRN